MKRILTLAKRTALEIVREPLSLIFCLGMPFALLLVFRFISRAAEGGWMSMAALVPGLTVFSLSFLSLFMALLVSRDRGSAFLTRLFNAPVKTRDFILGYLLPGVALGMILSFLTCLFGMLTCLIPDGAVTAAGIAFPEAEIDYSVLPPVTNQVTVVIPWTALPVVVLSTVPMTLFFVLFGVTIGSLLSDRAAPGVCSVVVSASGLLGGAWMPLSKMPTLEAVCRFLPFYPGVTMARVATSGEPFGWGNGWMPCLVLLGWCLLLAPLSVFVFSRVRNGK